MYTGQSSANGAGMKRMYTAQSSANGAGVKRMYTAQSSANGAGVKRMYTGQSSANGAGVKLCTGQGDGQIDDDAVLGWTGKETFLSPKHTGRDQLRYN